MSRAKKAPEGPTVLVAGVISDGKGGYLPKGAKLDEASAETIASLRAKGFAG